MFLFVVQVTSVGKGVGNMGAVTHWGEYKLVLPVEVSLAVSELMMQCPLTLQFHF